MISILAIILSTIVLVLCLIQTVLVIRYYRFHQRENQFPTVNSGSDQPVTNQPKAAIILCLRGHEDSIPDCLAGLMGQNYPDYELHIAFDSSDDPAVVQVKDFFAGRSSDVHLHFFEPQPSCSYKCSGIVHAIGQLNPDVKILAFCDGDAIVDDQWLEVLVQPLLQDANIGATTGNRWFSPYDGKLGGMLRKQWNAAAVVQMQAYDIAWGGSMAMRRSTIEDCNLLEIWGRSFCEDTPTSAALQQQGLRLYRIPDLIIENRESTSIKNCLEWISRQLLTVRLHHPRWKMVKAHGFATIAATLLVPLLTVVALLCGLKTSASWLIFAWVVYQVCNVVLLSLIQRSNLNAMTAADGRDTSSHEIPDGNLLSVFLVQLFYPVAFIEAIRATSVSWRGIEYQFSETTGSNGYEIKADLSSSNTA